MPVYTTKDAQQWLDDHPVDLTGECRGCLTRDCGLRRAAAGLFYYSLVLPRRRPLASRPEIVGARRVTP